MVDLALLLDLLLLRARVPGAFDRQPLPRTLERLAAHRPLARGSPAQTARAIARSERLISALALPRDTCLYRSLARFAHLRSQGDPVTFVMGVHEDHGHAWLERDGDALEELDYPYTVTYRYPAATPRGDDAPSALRRVDALSRDDR